MRFVHASRAAGALATTALVVSLAAGGAPQATGTGSAPPDPGANTGAKPASKETFRIDATHSMALFRVRHFNAGAFWGRFNDVTGSVEFDAASDRDVKLNVVMDITSVDTGTEKLDRHLMSEDFFWAEEHPTATFVSTSARRTATNTFEVTGDLTMRGVSRTITVPVEWLGTADGPAGRRAGFETTFTVRRSDYGINYGVENGALGDETRLVVAIECIAGGPERGGRGGRGAGGLLGRFDENKDGKLQRDELPEPMRDRFEELDTDGDGALDEEELEAARGPGNAGNADGRGRGSQGGGR